MDSISTRQARVVEPALSLGEKFVPTDRTVLGNIAQSIVEQAHAKTRPGAKGYPETPIGRGGKCDDTSCVVGEVVEWTEEHAEAWTRLRNERWWKGVFTCGGNLPVLEDEVVINSERSGRGAGKRNYPSNPNGSFSTLAASEYGGSFPACLDPRMRRARLLLRFR